MNWILFSTLRETLVNNEFFKIIYFSGISAELCCFWYGSMQKPSHMLLLSKNMEVFWNSLVSLIQKDNYQFEVMLSRVTLLNLWFLASPLSSSLYRIKLKENVDSWGQGRFLIHNGEPKIRCTSLLNWIKNSSAKNFMSWGAHKIISSDKRRIADDLYHIISIYKKENMCVHTHI